ncbi:MAG: radical SAM protein [Myxococcota bacterium]
MATGPVVSSGVGSARRVILPLTTKCNNSCLFCPVGSAGDDSRSLEESVVERARASASDPLSRGGICLVGGEPSLLPNLASVIEASGPDSHPVLLQTNGRRLAYPKYLRSLLKAGLSGLDVSLHGPTRQIHDYHTRAPGSFDQTVAALRAAAITDLHTGVTTVVTRSNYRHLSELLRLLACIGITSLQIRMARAAGRAAALLPSVLPRLPLLVPRVREARKLARRLGSFLHVGGLPTCAGGSLPLPNEPEGAFASECARCAARTFCAGLDPGYADRYGADEVSPLEKLPEHLLREREDPRRRRFVGLLSREYFEGNEYGIQTF